MPLKCHKSWMRHGVTLRGNRGGHPDVNKEDRLIQFRDLFRGGFWNNEAGEDHNQKSKRANRPRGAGRKAKVRQWFRLAGSRFPGLRKQITEYRGWNAKTTLRNLDNLAEYMRNWSSICTAGLIREHGMQVSGWCGGRSGDWGWGERGMCRAGWSKVTAASHYS